VGIGSFSPTILVNFADYLKLSRWCLAIVFSLIICQSPLGAQKNCECMNYRMLVTHQYKYAYVVICKFVSVGDIVQQYQIYCLWLHTVLNCALTTGV